LYNWGSLWPSVPDKARPQQRVYGSYSTYSSFTAIDCLYNVSQANGTIFSNRVNLVFNIVQYNCQSSFSKSLGGSSFDILAESDDFKYFCQIVDHFTDIYTVTCSVPSPQSNVVQPNKVFCLNVTLTLDYEHFDAYTDTSTSYLKLNHKLLLQTPMCATSLVVVPQVDSEKFDVVPKGWMRTNDSLYGQDSFRWQGAAAIFPSVSAMKACTSEQEIIWLGSSHQRYHWDYAAYLYFDKELLVHTMRKHTGGVEIGNMKYVGAVYGRLMAEYLNSTILPLCHTSSLPAAKNFTIIAMTGSWDLVFAPRRFIRDPSNGEAMIKVINNIKRKNCSNIRIVFATTVAQERYDGVIKNSYSIQAVIQWIHGKLVFNRVPIVDLFQMSRLHSTGQEANGDQVCSGHFLCHSDNYNGVYQTNTGYVQLASLLNSACEPYLPPQISPDVTTMIRDARIALAYGNEFYLIRYGLKRKILDNATLNYLLNNSNGQLLFLSNSSMDDYASDMPVPSWKDFNVYVTREFEARVIPSHEFWVIQGGERHQVLGVAALEAGLNTTFQNIPLLRVSYHDLLAIPLGISWKKQQHD
jgi:hypothetical protein